MKETITEQGYRIVLKSLNWRGRYQKLFRVNEDLSETIALAHDLGHTPFGHAGEEALNIKLKKKGGFNHNLHALKILTNLEQRYLNFDGLNLTWESLEGILKHNGPVTTNLPNFMEPILKDLIATKKAQVLKHKLHQFQMILLIIIMILMMDCMQKFLTLMRYLKCN